VRRSIALGLLAPTHARAVELADAGIDRADMARQLDLDPCAVEPLLRVARTKLAALEEREEPAAIDR
jgi:hypothetical protein